MSSASTAPKILLWTSFAPRKGRNETVVYIGRCDVHERKLVDLGAGIRHRAEVAEEREPQLISHGFRVDEAVHRMTVVVVHGSGAQKSLTNYCTGSCTITHTGG